MNSYAEMMEQAKKRVDKFMKHRNRHHTHKVGDVLYYQCEHMKQWRKGVVYNVIPHYSMNYYVLEVQTGPPINESFLEMVSEFNVKSEGEVDTND